MTHKWSVIMQTYSNVKGLPHICGEGSEWFHGTRENCCSIEIEKVDCPKCLEIYSNPGEDLINE